MNFFYYSKFKKSIILYWNLLLYTLLYIERNKCIILFCLYTLLCTDGRGFFLIITIILHGAEVGVFHFFFSLFSFPCFLFSFYISLFTFLFLRFSFYVSLFTFLFLRFSFYVSLFMFLFLRFSFFLSFSFMTSSSLCHYTV